MFVPAQAIALAENTIGRKPENGGNGDGFTDGSPMYTLNATGVHGVAQPIPFGVSEKPDVGHCLRSGASKADKHESTTYVAQPMPINTMVALRHEALGEGTGFGIGKAGDPAYTITKGHSHAVAQPMVLMDQGGSVMNVETDMTGTLRRETHGHEPIVMQSMAAIACKALYNQGFNHWNNHASTQETNTGEVLRTLREAVGEEAFAKWGLGILNSLQPPEILQQALHGLSIRPATFSRSWVVCCALGCPIYGSGWLLQSLRETGGEGCPPQGWGPPEQLAGELRAYLSELSQPGAQAQRFMCDLWGSAQGAGILREALSAVQEMGRSTRDQGQPTHKTMQVRRLTVEECEFLQGFPRSYTNIPWRKKPASECPDGPRYKALGNSMAVPVMAWIGKRIEMVEAL
jgi:DNA (cytosine-5)-methyltransferase 1